MYSLCSTEMSKAAQTKSSDVHNPHLMSFPFDVHQHLCNTEHFSFAIKKSQKILYRCDSILKWSRAFKVSKDQNWLRLLHVIITISLALSSNFLLQHLYGILWLQVTETVKIKNDFFFCTLRTFCDMMPI